MDQDPARTVYSAAADDSRGCGSGQKTEAAARQSTHDHRQWATCSAQVSAQSPFRLEPELEPNPEHGLAIKRICNTLLMDAKIRNHADRTSD